MFDSLYFLRENKVVPNILHVTMRRLVSIHLLYNLGLVSYVSAKIELGLKQFNEGGGKHQESQYLRCISNKEMTEGENENQLGLMLMYPTVPILFPLIRLS